ncbi:MAG: hydroxylamine reductase, partial [Duncaniella sp.]|nr:hydroxylamine reductase [Duncaniella sp.]
MFCYQCQETAGGKGCKLQGVCGKHFETSAKMDMLLYIVRGISAVNRILREKGLASLEASHEVMDALFTTITNANFDDSSLD